MNKKSANDSYYYLSIGTMDSQDLQPMPNHKAKSVFQPSGPRPYILPNLTNTHAQAVNSNAHTPSKTQLFIGGMSSNTDLTALQAHINQIVKSHTFTLYISVVKRLKRKTFSGYGIIKNIDSSHARILIELGHFKFDGCWFGIKPFLKNKSVINFLRNDRAEKKVYLRGISEVVNEADLEGYFMQFGDVLHVQIGKHQFTSIYKGFGFIEFSSIEAVKRVIEQRHHSVKGVDINCERSKLNNHALRKSAQDGSSNERSLELAGQSQAMESQQCNQVNDRRRQLTYISSSDHFRPFTHAVDKVASNHIAENLVFRIPLGTY